MSRRRAAAVVYVTAQVKSVGLRARREGKLGKASGPVVVQQEYVFAPALVLLNVPVTFAALSNRTAQMRSVRAYCCMLPIRLSRILARS